MGSSTVQLHLPRLYLHGAACLDFQPVIGRDYDSVQGPSPLHPPPSSLSFFVSPVLTFFPPLYLPLLSACLLFFFNSFFMRVFMEAVCPSVHTFADICMSHSLGHNISGTPWGKFLKFGINVPLRPQGELIKIWWSSSLWPNEARFWPLLMNSYYYYNAI